MPTVLFVLAAIGVTIYAIVDCWRSPDDEIRSLPKPLWVLVILGIPLFGGVLWILLGRLPAPGSAAASRRLRTIGPDDDPDFLRSLQPPRRRGERRKPEGEDDDGEPKPS
jgi:hypothetical protein